MNSEDIDKIINDVNLGFDNNERMNPREVLYYVRKASKLNSNKEAVQRIIDEVPEESVIWALKGLYLLRRGKLWPTYHNSNSVGKMQN